VIPVFPFAPRQLPSAMFSGSGDEKQVFPPPCPAFIEIEQKCNHMVQQQWAEMAAHMLTSGVIGFASSPISPTPQIDHMAAAGGTVAGYTRPAPNDLSAGR